jgi:hypothetical protein
MQARAREPPLAAPAGPSGAACPSEVQRGGARRGEPPRARPQGRRSLSFTGGSQACGAQRDTCSLCKPPVKESRRRPLAGWGAPGTRRPRRADGRACASGARGRPNAGRGGPRPARVRRPRRAAPVPEGTSAWLGAPLPWLRAPMRVLKAVPQPDRGPLHARCAAMRPRARARRPAARCACGRSASPLCTPRLLLAGEPPALPACPAGQAAKRRRRLTSRQPSPALLLRARAWPPLSARHMRLSG